MLQQARNREDTVYVNSLDDRISARQVAELYEIPDYAYVYRKAIRGETLEQIVSDWEFLSGKRTEYMSMNEATAMYGVTDQTIRHWIKSGKLKAEKHGQKIYIPKGQTISR